MVPNQHQSEAAVAWNLFRNLLRSLSAQLKSIVDSTEWHTCLCSVMPGWTWRLSRWDFSPTWIIQSCGQFVSLVLHFMIGGYGRVGRRLLLTALCRSRFPKGKSMNCFFCVFYGYFLTSINLTLWCCYLFCFCKIMSLQFWCWTNASCNATGKMFNQLGAEQVPVSNAVSFHVFFVTPPSCWTSVNYKSTPASLIVS